MPRVSFDQVVIFDEAPDEFYGTPGRILTIEKKKVEVQIYKKLGEIGDTFTISFERDDESMNGLLSWSNCGKWKIDRVYTI